MTRTPFVIAAATLIGIAGYAVASNGLRQPAVETVTRLEEAAPTVTRNGMVRYFDPALQEDGAPTWLIERLSARDTDAASQRGFAEALARVLSELPGPSAAHEAWVTLIVNTPDAAVRDTLVDGLAKADPSTAQAGLRAALTHPEPATRALAALTASLCPHGHLVMDALVAATADPKPNVRAQAVRAIGVLGGNAAAITPLTSDGDPEVAREATRALTRLRRD
jgi:HEAT repeat protein